MTNDSHNARDDMIQYTLVELKVPTSFNKRTDGLRLRSAHDFVS